MSAQSKMSSLPLSTFSALALTFELICTLKSTWPDGIELIPCFAQSGFRTTLNETFGLMFVTM